MAQVLELPRRLTTSHSDGVTFLVMPARIGPKRPVQVFFVPWRTKFGLTQEQVGARIGVDKGTVSRWETSKRLPSVGVCAAYAEALGINLPDIYRHPNMGQSIDARVDQLPKNVREKTRETLEFILKQAS